mmetsp:Transcript_5977/g.16992  ORF Transcript_5977/g.16992 Transcript_5977/m.16992 type:complete len:777 (+) Transcript_5977:126-2456(+)
MSEVTAEEALLKAKEIAARLTGAVGYGGAAGTGGVGALSNASVSAPVATDSSVASVPAPTAASTTNGAERSERKRKRWGSAPATTSATSGFGAEALPGLVEAKMKQQQVAAAKPAGPSTKRVWVPTTRERPETHFFSFLKERLSELSNRINSRDFNGDEQNGMELGGRGATTQTIFGMPLEPMHVTITGSDAFIAAAAPRLEELLAEGERAEREGPPPEDDGKSLEDNKGKYSSSALTLTRPYYQADSASRPKSEYRPATVAQLISGNPDVLGDVGKGSGTNGSVEILEESIRIPNGVVGFIIGRGGETISSMQARSGCKVQIQKEHELQPGQTERVITLQAVKQESIDECREIIESMVRDRVRAAGGSVAHRSASSGGAGGSDYYGHGGGGAGSGGRTDNTDAKVQEALAEGHKLVKVEVPDADVGLIIGKGGSTIKYIQETTGSSVQIPHSATPENPAARSISITCPTEQGAEAAKTQILNIIKNKMANNSQKGTHMNNMSNTNIGSNQSPSVSLQVVVPNKDVGLCIGRQGCVIRQLQNKTDTRIDIPQQPPPGQNVRVITVTGPTQEACNMAKTYIDRIVHEQSASSIMTGSPYSNHHPSHGNMGNRHHHGGPGLGYQNQYRNHHQNANNYNGNNNNNNNNGGDQNPAQSNDPAWQAYYAAQAIANKQQQEQQQQQAAAAAAPASDAYYEQFHRYSYYYGEEAARQYYGSWSPPVGTPNPYGTNPDGITAPPAGESGGNEPSQQATAPATNTQVRDSSVRKVSNLPAWMTKA